MTATRTPEQTAIARLTQRMTDMERRLLAQDKTIKAMGTVLNRLAHGHVVETIGDMTRQPRTAPVDEIVSAVAHSHGLSHGEICGDSKVQKYVDARREVARIAREQGYSLPLIGEAMGGRDHTTVANLLGLTKVRKSTTGIPAGQPATLAIPAPDRAVIEALRVEETAAGEGPDVTGSDPAPVAQEAPEAGGAVQSPEYGWSKMQGVVEVHPDGNASTRIEVIPQPAFRAQPLIPPQFPQGDIGRVLVAAKVDSLARGALYWFRADHRADLTALQAETGLTVDQIVDTITRNRRGYPDLARLIALADDLAGAERG